MKNRFFCAALFILTGIFYSNTLCAQLTFQFNYSGPDTLFVGNDCEAALEWGHPSTLTAECTLAAGGDCTVDTLEIFEISGGYLAGSPVAANETVTITYRAVSDTMPQEAFFSFSIFFADTLPPSFNIPPDVTINCDQSTDPALTGSVTAVFDNCGGIADTTFTDLVVAGSCVQDYSILRRWRLTDQNGNQSPVREQRIRLQDINKPSFSRLPVDQTISCGATMNLEAAFQSWIADHGAARATDNCTPVANLTWFAAVPGSFDISDPLSFPGEPVGELDTANCGTGISGIYRTEMVAFVVVDECGNASSSTAVFTVEDQQGPLFEFCPPDIVLQSEPGSCETSFTLPIPVITDDCADRVENINRSQTKAIRSSNPGDDQTIVDTIDFQINIPPVPAFVTNVAELDILLDNADAEAATEFFNILGEDQSILGQTNRTNTQCGSSLTTVQIPAAQFNQWTSDGILEIRLAPNVPFGQSASFGINDICPTNGGGGSASIRFEYQSRSPRQLSFSYQLDAAPEVSIDPATEEVLLLDKGNYNIRYRATDCAGNESSCLFKVTVEDREAPSLLCPVDISLALDTAASCMDGAPLTLSLPTAISDNCEPDRYEQVQPASSMEALMTFSYDPNYLDYIADDKSVAFVGTASNAIGNEVELEVRLIGEVDQPEAYYTVYGEDGSLIGTTEIGQAHVTTSPGDCMVDPPIPAQNSSIFSIPVATFNSWASDGIVDLELKSNKVFSGSPPGNDGDGINPLCGNFAQGTPDGSIDSVSSITVFLSYDRLTPSYSISGATNIPLSPMLPPSILPTPEFQAGSSIVTYVIADPSGNTASCSYEVTVVDTIRPTPICQAVTIFVNPSGSINYELDPQMLDAGSFDNCELSGRSVNPNTFSCDQIGTTQMVSLMIVDEFGNQSSCETLVQIEAELPNPDYSIGLCGNDTLYLLANPPAIPNGLNYIYTWSGPEGFASNLENPIIPNADEDNSGTYNLSIRGPSGCEVTTSFEVFINSSPNTPVIRTNNNQLCENDTLLLSTQSYSGSNISYNWYAGSFPSGTLLASTPVPLYKKPPPLSDETYYVIVEIDGCLSDASALAATTVSDVPTSSVQDAVLEVCEGGAFSLGTTISEIGYTYQWNGPNGFQSQSQYPSLVTDVSLVDSGIYTLVISNNGCTSDPASTVVRVKPRPDKPVLFTDGVVCNGDSLRFSNNITGGDLYTWMAPNGTNLSTTEPSLLILNANASHSGNWVVTVLKDGCNSAPSDSVNVFVEQAPILIATNNGPICAGDSVRLVANEIPGATYLWSGPGSFNSLGQRVDAPGIQGSYTVRVSSSLGCVTSVSTNVQTYTATQITAISTNGADCFFKNDTIRLVPTVFPADNGSYTYSWQGSNGFISSAAIPLIVLDSSSNNSTYSLQVMDGNGCDSDMETLQLNLRQAPSRPPIDGPGLICSGDALTLNSRPYAGSDVLYLWQTPLGVDTTLIPSLTISPVQPINSGDYSLRVFVDGCSSLSSIFIPVEVSAILPSPIVIANSPLCTGDTIRLSTDEVVGATYQWTGPDNFQFNGPEVFIVNASAVNAGNYAVQIDVNGCSSPFSIPVNVEVRPIPGVPMLEAVDPICIDAPNSGVRLQFVDGTAVQGASYTWYEAQNGQQIGGPTLSTSFLLNDFDDYTEGVFDFYVVANVGGCSSLPSIPLPVEMNTFSEDIAMAGADQELCDVNSVSLNAELPDVAIGQWRQTAGPMADIVQVEQASTQVNNLLTNTNYTFEWFLSNGVCEDYDSDEVRIFIGQNNAIAFAGDDFMDCGDGSVVLMADQPATGNGLWSSPETNLSFADAEEAETRVDGLEDGSFLFVWTVENGICGITSDSVVVVYELAPMAEDDSFESDYAEEVFIEVLGNDQVPLDFRIELTAGPSNGSVENLEDGGFRYKPGDSFINSDEFRYRLCSETCPDECVEAVVRIQLIRNLACEAPTIFTPNSDGINDAFEIPCFDSGQYPNNKVSIFNQWGDEVFRAAPYRNDWMGTYDGNPLPIGTYFYIVELGNGQEPISGFLVLER